MAWSSTSASGDQTPTSPAQSGSPSPGDGCGAGAVTFAEFLAQRQQYGGSGELQLPNVLLVPAPCGHCQKIEDLRRDWNTYSHSDRSAPQHHGLTVPDLDGSLANQIAYEGNSCFTCVKMIFEATQWTDGRDTPLHYAARSGNLRMLFHLLCLLSDFYGHEGAVAVLALRKLNGRGETALHEAIRLGTSKCMVGMLMWVDPGLAHHHAAGLLGTSPLYLAVSLGHKHIAEMLYRTSGRNLSYSGPDGQNALHAAVNCAYGMIEMLLGWNNNLSKEKDQNGSTPLHSVVSAQSEDYIPRCSFRFPYIHPYIRIPLEKHATWRVLDANPYAAYQQDKNGLLPVHIAALMDRKVAMLILLERCRGCIALPDKQGRSFLHIAVKNRVYRIVKYACQEPVFAPILNSRDNDGNTALHLAVEVEDLVIFCHLLGNPKVLLNVRNNKDQTPLDIAKSKKVANFSYSLNPENVIYNTLSDAGARHGSFWRDRVQRLCIQNRLSNQKDEENQSEAAVEEDEDKKEVNPVLELVKVLKKKQDKEEKEASRKKKEDEEKKDSDQMNDSTRTLGIGSVLITTITFGATFTVPAAVKAGNNSPDGIPGLFGTWYFNAFMAANGLAFASSLITTLFLMFSGMSMVKLEMRRTYFQGALILASSSLTCLTVAFILGLHMVLTSVGHWVSDTIFLISPLLLSYQTIDFTRQMLLTHQPLSVRRGRKFACRLYIRRFFSMLLLQYWPYIVIFSWAA